MKKITYIITRSDVIGGANVHLLDLIPLIAEQNIDVELLIGGNGIVYDKALQLGIPTHSIKSLRREINFKNDYRAYKEIKAHLIKKKPDLIHLHSSKAGIIGRLVAQKLDIPVLFTAHGWAFTDGVPRFKRILYRAIEQHFASYADKIITVSEYDKNLALKNNVSNNKQLTTIHNGIADTCFEKRHSENKTCELIMVARFDTPKDQMLLLKALTQLKDYNWRLKFVGNGPSLESCQHFCSMNGLEDRVFFLGERNDVEWQLANADIFVLTSRWEGFPISILEAMRAGLPVIASDVGGVSEAVIDKVTGFTVSYSNELALVDRLKKLICNPNTRQSLGQAGRERFLKFFTINRMVRKTINIYNDIIYTR